MLRVRESGFLGGDVPDEVRRRDHQANAEGWERELEAARHHCLRDLELEDLHGV